jgi:hypothetical protein
MTLKIEFESQNLAIFDRLALRIHKIQQFPLIIIDFWSKICLILYPSLGNFTTHITISDGIGNSMPPSWFSIKYRG